jgi:hypothetical protein
MRMRIFGGWFQQSKWRPCLRVYYRKATFRFLFLWTKGLNVKDVHKEMFPVYGGKCLSCKVVHICVTDVSLMTKRLNRRCGSGWDISQNTAFRRTGKAMGQVCQCWWRISREINVFFSGSNITCFTFYIRDLFTDSTSYIPYDSLNEQRLLP